MRDSAKLDKFLGKQVKITFFDNDTQIGVLKKTPLRFGKYIYSLELADPFCTNIRFCKSHVKKIEEVICG